MRNAWKLAVWMGGIAALMAGQAPPGAAQANWAQWRGPLDCGVAPDARPPLEWSETKNVRWKVAIPGSGHATPIVWQDRVFVQTAVEILSADPAEVQPEASNEVDPGGRVAPAAPTHVHAFKLLALERRTGKTVWERTLCEARPHEAGHRDASQASNSPATDGEHVYAYFGSRGLYCVTMQGEVVWSKQFGQMATRRAFGEGSSPALHGDTLALVWDHEGEDFIVALDKRTGQERWRQPRDEPTSWATPVVVEAHGRAQVVTSATNAIRSYDLQTGELVWECRGMTGNVIPTPPHDDRLVYCISGFRGEALLAVRYADARGDVTDAVAWKYDGKGTPYVPSPVLYDGRLYFLSSNSAQISCVDARTGTAHYSRQRLPEIGDVYASLVAADSKVYIVGRGGQTAVIAPGPELKVLAVNTLDDGFEASPVLVGDELFLRGRKNLYCIAAE